MSDVKDPDPEPDPGPGPGRGLGVRAARTAATRRRMVTAAYDLFCQRGYLSTTMNDIAQEAAVAVQTLYFTFGSKSALLHEAFVQAVLGPEPMPPDRQPWFSRMQRAPDVHVALGHAVGGSTAIFERVAPLVAAVQGVSADPEVAVVYARQEAMRRQGYTDIITILATKKPLRPGLSVARAADIFLVLVSPPVYAAFVGGCGWSSRDFRLWATETMYRELFRP